MSKKNYLKVILIVILVTIIMFGAGVGLTVVYFKLNPNSVEEITNITKTEKEVTVTDTGIADSVEKVYDGVVYIVTYKGDNPYASGTGFIYKKEGNTYYLLTNYHVINNSTKVTVQLSNKELYTAELLGGDKFTDTAVLSVETDKELTVLDIGSSEDTRIGDTVFTVGTPISSNYGWSATRGILSGKDRMVTVNITNSNVASDNVTLNVLQSDVSINSGNSGGPLCNINGEVIGITSSKVITSGVSGISFSIPIEDALNIAEKVIDGEDIERPYIGVEMAELVYAQYYGYVDKDIENGIYVSRVVKDSPAEKAGLKDGDVLIEINGIDIESVSQFRYELYKNSIGDTVKIKLSRDGSEKEVNIKLGTNPQ